MLTFTDVMRGGSGSARARDTTTHPPRPKNTATNQAETPTLARDARKSLVRRVSSARTPIHSSETSTPDCGNGLIHVMGHIVLFPAMTCQGTKRSQPAVLSRPTRGTSRLHGSAGLAGDRSVAADRQSLAERSERRFRDGSRHKTDRTRAIDPTRLRTTHLRAASAASGFRRTGRTTMTSPSG